MARGSRYNETYKREAVRKAQVSGSVAQTANELGISAKTLYGWIKQFGYEQAFELDTATPDEMSARIRQLERQLAQNEQQVDVLKKLSRLSAKPTGAIRCD
jgi:transposase-like protein